MPCVSGAWCALPQETIKEKNTGFRKGWQFYSATSVVFKTNIFDNFEDDFYHVSQMLATGAQDGIFGERTNAYATFLQRWG